MSELTEAEIRALDEALDDEYRAWATYGEAGVAAEIANAEMCDGLLAATQRADLLTVLRKPQEASRQRHLPAFQRCAQGGAQGLGAGRRRGARGRSG